jgi:hypothetical protein
MSCVCSFVLWFPFSQSDVDRSKLPYCLCVFISSLFINTVGVLGRAKDKADEFGTILENLSDEVRPSANTLVYNLHHMPQECVPAALTLLKHLEKLHPATAKVCAFLCYCS